jgi:hypothetical protein
VELDVGILLTWCCDCSPNFADVFVAHFESIFEGSIATATLIEVFSPIYLRAVLNRDDVSAIELFVEKAKRDSMDQEKTAALFGAMSKLQKTDLQRLDKLALKTWEDPCSAGPAELNYLKATMKFYDDERLFKILSDLENRVRDKIDANQVSGDCLVKQFWLLFTCQTSKARTLRSHAVLTDIELMAGFDQNGLRTLGSLLSRQIALQVRAPSPPRLGCPKTQNDKNHGSHFT